MRSFSIFSSTDTRMAEAAIAGIPEASKGKDGRRCQTSGGSASEGAVCRVCEGGSGSAGFLYRPPRIPSGAVTECAAVEPRMRPRVVNGNSVRHVARRGATGRVIPVVATRRLPAWRGGRVLRPSAELAAGFRRGLGRDGQRVIRLRV